MASVSKHITIQDDLLQKVLERIQKKGMKLSTLIQRLLEKWLNGEIEL